MNELYHFGVKGMKWGVRKDRKRSVSSKRSRSDSKDYAESRDLLKKSPNKLSNAELRKINERLNLEQQYSNLTTIQKQKGQSFVKRVKNQMSNTAVNEVSSGLYNTGKAVLGALAGAAATAAVNYMMNRNGGSAAPQFIRQQIGR